jgi:hypothetical protein
MAVEQRRGRNKNTGVVGWLQLSEERLSAYTGERLVGPNARGRTDFRSETLRAVLCRKPSAEIGSAPHGAIAATAERRGNR